MQLSEDKKKKQGDLVGIIVFSLAILALEWVIKSGFFYNPDNEIIVGIYKKIYNGIIKDDNINMVVKIVYVVINIVLAWYTKSPGLTKKFKDKSVKVYLYIGLVFSIGVIISPFLNIYIYHYFIYPIFVLFIPYVFAVSFCKRNTTLEDDGDFWAKVNQGEASSLSLDLETNDKGVMSIPDPNQGIKIIAGTGSGKTVLLETIIHKLLHKGYCGILHDWEGNPLLYREGADENPMVLTTLIYTELNKLAENVDENGNVKYYIGKIKGKKVYEYLPPVTPAFLNFMDLSRTVRVNPLSPNYIKSELTLGAAVTLFMKAVDIELTKKTDFWAKGGITYVNAIARMLYKHNKEYLTIPHIITITLSNSKKVLNWIATDSEGKRAASTIMEAFDNKAESQLAGQTATGSSPLQPLYDKNIFWVLSPTQEQEYNLDITNPENPSFLCIGNDNEVSDVLKAPISTIMNTCMMNMNVLGKRKSLFAVEEFPQVTFNAFEISKFIATARKKKVVFLVIMQDVTQGVAKYGRDQWDIIMNTMVNTFIGRITNSKFADEYAKSYGKIRKLLIGSSHNASSSGETINESTPLVEACEGREILAQPTGQFTGRIADGNPAQFRAQFPYNDYPKIKKLEQFSAKYDIGNEEDNIKAMEKLAELNFTKINSDIDKLLEQY